VFVPESLGIQWSDLIRFKRTFTDPFVIQRENEYLKSGIQTFHGEAEFESPNDIKILGRLEGTSNSEFDWELRIRGKKIVIATGAKPADLMIKGSEFILTSDQFLSYEHNNLPDRIIFIGGGFISFEFAHVAARAGVKEITIIHRGPRPLNNFDPHLVKLLLQKCKEVGINVMLNTTIESIQKSALEYNNDEILARLVNLDPKTIGHEKKYQNRVISTDLVVHGAGRVANIEGLNLEKGNVESSSKGILVNDFLQSVTNPDVYAAGDVVANISPNVTPKAEYDGKLVSTNLLSGNTVKTTYDEIPRVVFTIPALASVGKNEMELNKGGFNYRVNYQDTSKWYTSRRDGETCSGFKVLIDNESEKILGAHLIGPHAEEVINIFSLAIKLGLTTSELRNSTLYSYPTNGSDIPYMLN
jgi:glutathione reductase (NADPH)